MKKYSIFFLITFLIITTSIIKNSTRELETKIFNSKEKIKILTNKRDMVLLQNNYLSSPQRLFELKKEFFGEKLEVLEHKQFKNLIYNEKR
tara:strand:+ start:3280 stop:3552 length:273 start_codon:yes stop_codon:yes gene_type:complete